MEKPEWTHLLLFTFVAWFVHDSLTFSYSSETVDNQMLLYFYYFCLIVFYDFFCYTSFELASHTLCAISVLKYIFGFYY